MPEAIDTTMRAWLWRSVGRPLFRYSPQAAFAFRRALLRRFGADLHDTTKIRPSVEIDRPWNLRIGERTAVGDRAALRARAPIHIGDRCTVSQLTILSTEALDAHARTASAHPITIEHDAWVAADALVLPGVRIGAGAVVGARSLVEDDVAPWTIALGQPAGPVKARRFTHTGPEQVL